MLNHPGCLKVKNNARGSKDKFIFKPIRDAWLADIKANEYDNMHLPRNSPKLILLAHTIALAFQRDEKIIICSLSLQMLDLVEEFICFYDWKKRVGSLRDSFPHLKLGSLKKNKDYVRIDGSIQSAQRGNLVHKFNKDGSAIKIFLISSLAGGIGINLVSTMSHIHLLYIHFP
jgi:SNF2 family DNA or RNA helicase